MVFVDELKCNSRFLDSECAFRLDATGFPDDIRRRVRRSQCIVVAVENCRTTTNNVRIMPALEMPDRLFRSPAEGEESRWLRTNSGGLNIVCLFMRIFLFSLRPSFRPGLQPTKSKSPDG